MRSPITVLLAFALATGVFSHAEQQLQHSGERALRLAAEARNAYQLEQASAFHISKYEPGPRKLQEDKEEDEEEIDGDDNEDVNSNDDEDEEEIDSDDNEDVESNDDDEDEEEIDGDDDEDSNDDEDEEPLRRRLRK